MVRFSEIQQFPDFLELFPGNFCAICLRFENFGTCFWSDGKRPETIRWVPLTATRTPPNKRFNEQNNGYARVL